jgi:hypothetical protein
MGAVADITVPAILVAPETASQHVRNALQLLDLLEQGLREPCTPAQRMDARRTVQAIGARLWLAVRQLEAK